MDYRAAMGIERLAASECFGEGVRIAVLDSGVPQRSQSADEGCLPSEPHLDDPDTYGHATAISSILSGGWGITGICPNACVMYYSVLDGSGNGSVESVVDGIWRAIDDEVDIINLSIGFARTDTCPRALARACDAAYDAGIAMICAAGNDGGAVNWPAALDTTISVGSSDKNGLKTSFSSTGEVDFVAPGMDLGVSTIEGRIKNVCGTSFSTAIVTGVAALLVHGMMDPFGNFGGMEAVKDALRGIAQDVDAPGWDRMTGYGLISGKNSDTTVCMEIKRGFFGRIIAKLQGFFGFGGSTDNKEKINGSIV